MALTILVLLTTLFFMVFFSIYKRHFAGSDDDRRRRNPSLSSSSSSARRQLTESMASSSSSYASDSQNCTQWKYNVFLSFRGDDTRKTFTSHLFEGLKNRGIFTFQDDKRLEKGDSIPEELLKAIEESQVALVIFSKNYATSSWCLNELVKIMECKEVKEQIVIPVFYDVDPSDVRHQTGSFAKAFSKHKSRYKDDVDGMQMVQGWRTALSAAANLSGCNVHDRIESECIRELVDDLSSKLCKTSSSYLQYTVGIDTHLEEVKSLLEMETDDVRILGIWGMGGVGKTTLARAVFDTLSPQFQYASFLEDVKETNINEMHSLQNKLLSELLREDKKYVNNKTEGKRLMAERLRFMKVLVVLDDINHHDHLEYLAGNLDWFGSGSRIIATTRDREILGMNNVVHEVTTLLEPDAIQLFNHYAFKGEAPDEYIKKLALEVVSHAKGLPLALRLWGTWLYNKDKTKWREAVDKIKRESSRDVVEKLEISFEGLQDEEKTMFLDIACFFRGWKEDDIIKILESYDLYPRIRLCGLIEKSLVSISKYKTIQMHDLIQDMGRYIVKKQKDSGKPSRVWNVEDFEDVMMGNMGTREMEAIWFTYSKKPCFSKDAMKNMQSLRILGIFPKDGSYMMPNFNCPSSIEYLSSNLRCFVWHHYPYPWKLLPENFNPRRLVHLDLRWNSLQYLCNETKLPQFPSLQRIDLSCSKILKRTPDFEGMPNLKYLNLEQCTRLEEVHPSLKDCKKLIELNLSYCTELQRFPYVNVESLESLNLKYCYSLEKCPEIMKQGTTIKIKMSCSGIRELPLSFFDLQPHLTELELYGMKNLVSLPSSIWKLKGLVRLNVSYWSKVKSWSEEMGDLDSLEELPARYIPISRPLSSIPPCSIVRLNKLKSLTLEKEESKHTVNFVFPQVSEGLRSLESLDLSYCNIIDGGLPQDIGSLSYLKKLNLKGNNFEYLPHSIAQLSALQTLNLSDCKRLRQLPGFTGMQCLDTLDLSFCNLTDGGLPQDIGSLSSLKKLNLKGNNFEYLPHSIAQLGALQTLNLSHCKRLRQLPGFTGMQCLDTLDLSFCNLTDGVLLDLLDSIGQLGALRILDLLDCKRLTQQLDTICVDWRIDWICNSLFQNFSALQHDISASDSLSLRVFTLTGNIPIPRWFDHREVGRSISVKLPENWYVSDNFLGFAVCYSGKLIDAIAHLICYDERPVTRITQKLALSNHSEEFQKSSIHFFLVPLTGLLDKSKANGKTPNDYGRIRIFSTGEMKEFGLRLLYKDKPKIEASCSSSQKQ